MAKKTKLTATLPNGEMITRTTERTYTHVVVYTINEAKMMAACWVPDQEKQERKNFKYYVECAAGEHEHRYAPAGSDQWKIDNAATYRKQAQDIIAEFPTVEAYLAGRKAKAEYYARKQIGAGWHVAGWCGRPDLAQKLAAGGCHHVAGEIKIIEVN
jgi:hypothetical protein